MTAQRALIVDDERDIRELLTITLSQLDLEVFEAADLKSAKQLLTENNFAFCLTDMKLPDGNGLSLVEHIQNSCPDMPVAVISAHGNMGVAVDALKKGAFDFVSKPVELSRLRSIVKVALELSNTKVENNSAIESLTGNSPAMDTLRLQILRVARSQAPILIRG
jgi:two-component system response regulator PilR (NtrC family)